MLELLKSLCGAFGVSGREDEIRDLISDLCADYCDEMTCDGLGNLIVHKKGEGPKLMLAAHMDQIGFIATSTDDNGFVRFAPVGGLSVLDCVHRAVVFENGVRGVVCSEEKVKRAELKLADFYIDIGANDKRAADKPVKIGDCARYDEEIKEVQGGYFGPYMDDRAGCAVLISALKRIKKSAYDLYFVFTVQEEVGLRGARTSAYLIEPDYAVAVDVTDTGDTPNCPDMAVKLGKGPCVKIKDGGIISHREVIGLINGAAKKAGVKVQNEILVSGSTDAGAIHTSRGGVKSGGLSIATRYVHSPAEHVSAGDLDDAVSLLCALIEG